MCAIAGIVGLSYDDEIIGNMLLTMKHRGPDEKGYYFNKDVCLLHTRLSVIDPEGGKQPMHIHWGGHHYSIVYNGELYNTDEIRTELLKLGHTFLGHSDTEVVLHSFVQWGAGCVHRFNGIFAFAVMHWEEDLLFLARDRMGVKPVFYKIHEDGFLFASELKTILKYPSVDAELDGEGISQIIMLGPGRIPGSGVFRNIYELEPGCYGIFQKGSWQWKRYWKLTDREHIESFEETAEKVRFLVTDAIKRQMVSDVPIGTFLSGGLDSSLITAVCAKMIRNEGGMLPTFSVDYLNNEQYFVPGKYQPNSDNKYIDIMKNYVESDHHWTVLTPEDLVNSMEKATFARDLPGMADVDFSLLAFCGEIRKEVKVALSGECADEIFGGYPWYRDPEIRDREGFPWAQNTKQRASFLSGDIQEKIPAREFVMDCYKSTLNQCDILPNKSPQEYRTKQMVNLNLRWFMQTLLDRKDRMSMYHGLEVRVPFCDYRIAEYLYGVPWEYKEYQGKEKGLLRYAMRDYLPDSVLYRKKSPYPKTYDPRYLQIVSERLKILLENNQAPIYQIVNKKALIGLLETEFAWPWYGQLMRVPQTIAYMLQIDQWLREYKVKIVL